MFMPDDNDVDRGRRRRRRGGGGGGRRDYYERDPVSVSVTPPPMKTPIILTKREPVKVPEKLPTPPVESSSGSQYVPVEKVPILLKSRDNNNRAVLNGSVPVNLPGLITGDAVKGQATYTTQQPLNKKAAAALTRKRIEAASRARLAQPQEMTKSVKIIDDGLNWNESAMDVLLDQTDFLVVGVLGMQGVGKSTILSLLSKGDSETDDIRPKSLVMPFRPQGADARDTCGHQTIGIDMYVTTERIIYLDTQPLMSSSILHHIIQQDKKYPADFASPEDCVEIQSLQVATFLMTVCNVVLVVADWFVDSSLVRCLRAAEMLRPPTPSNDSSKVPTEYQPHVAFVLNRAKREDLSGQAYNEMQAALAKMMDKSKLRCRGGINMATVSGMPALRTSQDRNMNLFLLPEHRPNSDAKDDNPITSGLLRGYHGHPGFGSLTGSLRRLVYGAPRFMLTHTNLSEKNWFHYAGRTWEGIKKSQLFAEYNRLLP